MSSALSEDNHGYADSDNFSGCSYGKYSVRALWEDRLSFVLDFVTLASRLGVGIYALDECLESIATLGTRF